MLQFPDYNKKFTLEYDVSDIGIGSDLYQEHEIIKFNIKKHNKTERNYSIVEKELYSITVSIL